MEGGVYIYAIAATDTSTVLDIAGVDGSGGPVETLPQGEMAAIVSRCSADRYDVTRANTVAHQRVMEAAMKRWTILPVRFCTIAQSREQIIEKLLIQRQQEFRELLDAMAGKVELGLKALWTNMEAIFAELVEENPEIKRARARKIAPTTPAHAVSLGEMVKDALDRKKRRECRQFLRHFDGLWYDRRVNDVFGDSMIVNASFLVGHRCEEEFDRCVKTVDAEMNGRVRLKYVGPVPPLNFVEIVVTWE